MMMNILEGLTCTVLPNGLEVWVLPWRKSQAVLQAAVRTGSAMEEEFTGYGISHFLEHMLFDGCRNYPDGSYDQTIRKLGGYTNAYTITNRTVYYQNLPNEHWRTGLAMLADQVLAPDLTEKAVLKERQVICRESEFRGDNPDSKLLQRLCELLCPESPATPPVGGYPELIREVTPEMLRTYYERRYSPHRSLVVLAADAEPAELLAEAEKCFGSWERRGLREPVLFRPALLTAKKCGQIVYPDPMERFYAGVKLPEPAAASPAAQTLLLAALFTDSSALLVRELVRKQRVLAGLGAFAWDKTSAEQLLIIGGEAEPGKLDRGIKAFYAALAKELTAGIKRTQLRQLVLAEEVKQLSFAADPEALSGAALDCALAGRPMALAEGLEKLRRVTPDEVNELGRELLNPEHFAEVRQLVKAPVVRRRDEEKAAFAEGKLANGMKFLRVGGDSLMHVELTLPGGTVFEPADLPGISKLWKETVFCGAGSWDEEALLEQLDRNGLLYNAGSGNNTASLQFTFLKSRAAAAGKLLRQILTEPAFPPSAVTRERENRRHELELAAVNPVKMGFELAGQAVFGNHQLGRTGKEMLAALDRLTPEALREFHRSLFTVRGVIAVGGDCTEEYAREFAGELLAGIPLMPDRRPAPLPAAAAVPPQTLHLDKEQTLAAIGLRCPDCVAVLSDLALNILRNLENGLSSPLMTGIREQHGLSYSCGMRMCCGLLPGMVNFYALTNRDGAAAAQELIQQEIRRLAGPGVTEAEFQDAVKQYNANIRQEQDSFAKMLQDLGLRMFYGRPAAEVFQYCDEQKLTVSRFNAWLKSWLRPEYAAAVTVIGDKEPRS